MRFHIEIRTDDLEIVEALTAVKNRAKLIKKALKYYLSTKQGREALKVMLKQGVVENSQKEDIKDTEDVKAEQKEKMQNKAEKNQEDTDEYDFDRFL